MTDAELADLIIARLNDVLQYDSEAVRRLIDSRVECNDALADHPTVQVRSREGEPHCVGFLGVLNGLVGTIQDGPRKGWGFITAVVEDDGTISGFCRTSEE